jgi:alginate O-acetyltransferase complex protein AlgJ
MEKRLTREEIAALEVGHTNVDPKLAFAITVIFVGIIMAVPLAGFVQDARLDRPTFTTQVKHLLQGNNGNGRKGLTGPARLWRYNNRLLEKMDDFEDKLEKNSILRQLALAPGHRMLLELGYGNENVYPGKNHWLFYRSDIDHLIGQPFLSPDRLQQRIGEGKIWEKSVQPDPLPAILDFKRQLQDRGIKLILMPTPIKASLHPDAFAAKASWNLPLQNRSWSQFLHQLKEIDIEVFDPAAILEQRRQRTKKPVFLQTDTHWRPEAMEEVASVLASVVKKKLSSDKKPFLLTQLTETVENRGDIAAMLRLPEKMDVYDREMVTIHPVVTRSKKLWQPSTSAEVLLLGDSFANIFSLAGMGWGEGSGLGEQLSFSLGRPIDVLLQNDSGAFATRELLAAELARGRDRLAGKKVVIWQFASRELSSGNWKILPLELRHPRGSDFLDLTAKKPVEVTAVVAAVSSSPVPGSVPYPDNIITLHLVDIRELETGLERGQALVYCWGMRDNILTHFARIRSGEKIKIRLVDWDSVAPEYSSYRRSTLGDDMLELELPVWGETLQ